jgi:hypothetical protein
MHTLGLGVACCNLGKRYKAQRQIIFVNKPSESFKRKQTFRIFVTISKHIRDSTVHIRDSTYYLAVSSMRGRGPDL